jgi:hypothetical protein
MLQVHEKLRRRNAMYRGSLLILTYEDLLARAKQILRFLEGAGRTQLPNEPFRRTGRKRRALDPKR